MNIHIATAQYPISQHTAIKDWQIHTEHWIKRGMDTYKHILLFPEYASMELVSLFEKSIQIDVRKQVQALDGLKNMFCDSFCFWAKKYDTILIAPSFPIIENGHIVNRTYVFSPKGLAGYQDKLFMTRFEQEEWGVESPEIKTLSLFEAEWGKFGIQICYDVEFPIGANLLSAAGASLLLVPSCTETIRGAMRVHIGARARALENQIYTIVAQTVGNADWSPAVDVNYGFAAAYSTPDKFFPENGVLAEGQPQAEYWLMSELYLTALEAVRNDGQVFNFKDHQRFSYEWKNAPIEIIRYRV